MGEATLTVSSVLVREAEREEQNLRWEVAELRARLERLEQASSGQRHGDAHAPGTAPES